MTIGDVEMARRRETEAERAARERVKSGFDAQMSAVNDFFSRERRIETMRVDIAALEMEQADAVSRLSAATSVAHAAEVLGWPQSKVREASARVKRPIRTAVSTTASPFGEST